MDGAFPVFARPPRHLADHSADHTLRVREFYPHQPDAIEAASQGRDVLLLGPPGTGKSHLVQALGYQAIKAGFTTLYRSIFDVVRDFLHDEALGGDEKVLARYLKPELLVVDDMGISSVGPTPRIRRSE